MCFNKEVSGLAFFFGLCAGLQLIREGFFKRYNLCVVGIIIILIALMQLNEYFIWKFEEDGTENEKQLASLFTAFTLLFQYIISYIFIFPYMKFSGNSWIAFLSILTSILGLIYVIIFSYCIDKLINDPKWKEDNKSYKDIKTCKLSWGPFNSIWKNNKDLYYVCTVFYLLAFFTLVLLVPNIIILPILILLSLIFAIIYSAIINQSSDTVFGSLWCILAVLLSIFCVIFRIASNPPEWMPKYLFKE